MAEWNQRPKLSEGVVPHPRSKGVCQDLLTDPDRPPNIRGRKSGPGYRLGKGESGENEQGEETGKASLCHFQNQI
jgi:hypothetical protein